MADGDTPDNVPQEHAPVVTEQVVVEGDTLVTEAAVQRVDGEPEAPITKEVTEEEAAVANPPFNVLEGESKQDIAEAVLARRVQMGTESFVASTIVHGSTENVLGKMHDDYSSEAERAQDAIADHVTNRELFDSRFYKDGRPIIGMMTPKEPDMGGKTLHGRSALIAFARSKISGAVKRIPLLNSGFWIEIQAPTLNQLHRFYRAVHEDTVAYGRQYGAHFYMYADLIIKQAIVDTFIPLVVNSNLKNWDKGGTLISHIRIHDYKHILWVLGCMKYPDGYEGFKHACVKCGHVEEQKVDLTKFIRHNFGVLNSACIQHLCESDEVTPEMLVEYQKQLGFNKEIRLGDIGVQLSVPSLAKYLDYGRVYNGQLLNEVHAENLADVYNIIAFRFIRIFTPWVKKITRYKEDGEVSFSTEDMAAISDLLDFIQTEDREEVITSGLATFANETQLTHICYPVSQCPKCSNTPTTKSGYHTVDAERTFFTISVRKLLAI